MNNTGFKNLDSESSKINSSLPMQQARPTSSMAEIVIDTSKPDRKRSHFEELFARRPIVKERFERIKELLTEKRRMTLTAVLGEGLCTFLFIFVVCATQLNQLRNGNGPFTQIVSGISTAFLSVALIYSFADVSGAHFNPAVTFATMITRKTSLNKGLLYIGMQLFASIFSLLFLLLVFPHQDDLIEVLVVKKYQDTNYVNALATEFILTFILVYVIFAVAFDTVENSASSTAHQQKIALPFDEDYEGGPEDVVELQQTQPRQLTPPIVRPEKKKPVKNLTIYTTTGNSKAGFAPIAIGFTLGFLCFVGGSTSGGAFNPARAFAPALLSWNWGEHWVYWLGDFSGAAAAGLIQGFFAAKKK